MSNQSDAERQRMVESGQPFVDLAEAVEADGPLWDTKALQEDFEVLGFAAPFVVVRRRVDGVRGTLEFVHSPRIYFNFVAD